MIPVITANKEGEMSYQVFNDNQTPQEQINRKLLETTIFAQTNLVNINDEYSRMLMANKLNTEELKTLDTAATTLNKAVKDAITTFITALNSAE